MTWTSRVGRFREPVGATRMALFLQILDRFPPGRLLDLGAGHGLFSRLAADVGWKVTAVDARDERFPVDARIEWVKQDIRECDVGGFDVVACLGLWYHLTLDDQLQLARRAAGTPLIVDTHIAVGRRAHPRQHRTRLSRVRQVDGFEGRFYGERDMQDRLTASFGNHSSFWPTEESLRTTLRTSGYDIIETFDPPVASDRRFFLATTISPERGASLDGHVGKYIAIETSGSDSADAAGAG